jgi:hypothetical protein
VTTPAQEKLADCVVMMAALWPQICKKKKKTVTHSTNKLPALIGSICDEYQLETNISPV